MSRTGAGGLGSEVIKQLEERNLNINFVVFDLADYIGTRREFFPPVVYKRW